MDMTFEEYLAGSAPQIGLFMFIINLILTGTFAFVLSLIYIRYGFSLSNRDLFSRNFVLIAMTTMLIITIVKSSLALSLGLVGALSIIRFRAAIKEPEELAYLFITISIGLGFGANQGFITAIGLIIMILSIILLQKTKYNLFENQNLQMVISISGSKKISIDSIIEILSKNCSRVDLKRIDEVDEKIEVSLHVDFNNIKDLSSAKKSLFELDNSLRFSFLDTKGIF